MGRNPFLWRSGLAKSPQSGSLEALNTSFINNRTDESGAGFYAISAALTNSTLSGNVAALDGGGGFATEDLRLANVTVSANIAISGQGGGVALTRTGTIVGSTFIDNATNGRGGGLYQSLAEGSVMITDSRFFNNSSELQQNAIRREYAAGGGAYIAGSLTIERSRFEQNFAEQNGGGVVQAASRGHNTIRDVLFAESVAAEGWGGGMAFVGSGLFERIAVLNNYARVSGGGLRQYTPSSSTQSGAPVEIRSSQIIGNIAEFDSGGGLHIIDSLTMQYVDLRENQAGSRGGGLYRRVEPDDYTLFTHIDQSLIADNQVIADEGGGAFISGVITITNSLIIDNSAGTFDRRPVRALRRRRDIGADEMLALTERIFLPLVRR